MQPEAPDVNAVEQLTLPMSKRPKSSAHDGGSSTSALMQRAVRQILAKTPSKHQSSTHLGFVTILRFSTTTSKVGCFASCA